MVGQELSETARDGDTVKVTTLMSTDGGKSFINYQNGMGLTPFHCATPIFRFLFSVGPTSWENPLPIAQHYCKGHVFITRKIRWFSLGNK